MTNPMNPVLKPGTLSLPAKGSGVPQKAASEKEPPNGRVSRQMARLDMKADYALTQWLHGHTIQPGETLGSLAAQAARDLEMPIINANHIQTRLQAFGMKLLPSPASDAASRLSKLEKVLDALITDLYGLARHSGLKVHPLVQQYVDEREAPARIASPWQHRNDG